MKFNLIFISLVSVFFFAVTNSGSNRNSDENGLNWVIAPNEQATEIQTDNLFDFSSEKNILQTQEPGVAEAPAANCKSCPEYDWPLEPDIAGGWKLDSWSIFNSGDCKIYRIPVEKGRLYTFKTGCGDGATANFDTVLELYNGSCAFQKSADDGCESLRSLLEWQSTYTGYAFLRVRGFGGATGSYTLAYRGVGCLNTTSYGTQDAPTICEQSKIFSYINFASDYMTMNNAVAGVTYEFTSSISSDFMTVRKDTYDGPIVAWGQQPLTLIAPSDGSYFIHLNTNSSCGTEYVNRTTKANYMSPMAHCEVTATGTTYGIRTLQPPVEWPISTIAALLPGIQTLPISLFHRLSEEQLIFQLHLPTEQINTVFG